MSNVLGDLFSRNPLAVWVSVLITMAVFSSSLAKLANLPGMKRKWNDQLQMPDSLRIPAGIVELLAAILFLFPVTQHIGGIILTGYLGGAIALHLRIRAFGVALYAALMIAIVWTTLAYRN